MEGRGPAAKNIDEYIAHFPEEVRAILERIRGTIRGVVPEAQEAISYGIPTFKQNGILVHFSAFKNHIGFYPPVRGDEELVQAVAPYAGEKGNLRFPLKEPIPYDLIERITRLRASQNLAKVKPRRERRSNK